MSTEIFTIRSVCSSNSLPGLSPQIKIFRKTDKKAHTAILDLIKSIKTYKYVKIDLPKFLFQRCWLQDCSG